MGLSLFKMTLQGKIAVFNLVLFAILLLVGEFILCRIQSSAFNAALMVITFPLGWLASAMSGRDDTLMYLIAYQPLNAYLWGYVVSGGLKWLQHMSRPDSGTPVEENIPEKKK